MIGRQDGAALIGAVLGMVILSLLGTVSLTLAIHEIEGSRAAHEDAAVLHLAEAGSDLIVQRFHDPQAGGDAVLGALFTKRYELADGTASFFDAQGKSQFAGAQDRPDFMLDAAIPEHDRLLNDPAVGWFRSLRSLGRLLRLKVYGPVRPGLLCTVEATAGVGGLTRTLSVQLGARTIPPLRAAAQIGSAPDGTGTGEPLPVLVHWGDLKVRGPVRLGRPEDTPIKTQLAPISELSYTDMIQRQDRWLDLFIGGETLFDPSASGVSGSPPSNVFPNQEPSPGLREDRWDYALMKQYALLYGTYYVPDRNGLLYRDGKVEPGLGLTPEEVFGSEAVGDHHGLVFVDTLDQQPPVPGNLAVLTIETDYAEGVFFVNAHLRLKARGNGKPVPALSPPPEGSAPGSSLARRVPVQLTGIHLHGVLFVAGDIVMEGQPRLFGALATGGRVMKASQTAGPFELWFNDDLRSGLVRGFPLVYVAPGTLQERS